MRRAILSVLLGGCLVVFARSGARALPKFAAKEKKACAFCHVRPTGGGSLTAAGKYYDRHGKSLQGFKPGAPEKPAPRVKGAKSGVSNPQHSKAEGPRVRRHHGDDDAREHGGRERHEREHHERDDD